MGLVDVSHAPVGVVVTVGASAEGSLSPLGFRLPVLVVVAEAVHLHISLTVVVALQLPPRLSLLFHPLDFLLPEPFQLPVFPLPSSLLLHGLLGLRRLRASVAETDLGFWIYKGEFRGR